MNINDLLKNNVSNKIGNNVKNIVGEDIVDIIHNSKLRIYNTLTRKKEDFISINSNEVLMYSCGPTVYSDAHIGNLRSYLFPDILKNTLIKIGYDVKHIINITDVGHLTNDSDFGDDKMEISAFEKGKNIWEISEMYTERYKDDLINLNIDFPNKFTKATDYIVSQIEMVKGLEEKGYTYTTNDGVYFDTSKFEKYCDFAKLDINNMMEGMRVNFGEKRNKTDFSLWKFSPKNEQRQMEWDSPWGVGFPGWHIECSAMIWKELGEKIDIHTGGIDHIPVHHSNEIAQSTCFHGKPPVNYWLHGEFLILDKNKRIGKSEGNALTLNSLIEKGYRPIAYKYLLLTSHYRSKLTFSEESLIQSEKAYDTLKNLIFKSFSNINDDSSNFSDKAKEFFLDIFKYLLDDLNTSVVLAKIRGMFKKNVLSDYEKIAIVVFFDSIFKLDLLSFSDIIESDTIPDNILELANERWNLKIDRKFDESDKIRNSLLEQGYTISDYTDYYDIKKYR